MGIRDRSRGRGFRRSELSVAIVVVILSAMTEAATAQDATARTAPVSRPSMESDFNGDGFADLAVAEPQESVGSVTLAGAVSVFFGSATGIAVTGNQLWSQATAGVLDTPETGDGFGAALAAGDFDGDGFGDLAIGVPNEDLEGPATLADAGAVQILHGSAAGLSKTGNQLFTQVGADPDAATEAGDRFGSALAAGDVNGDGMADLVVGTPDEAIGSTTFAGAVSVLFGSPSGLTASGAQFWSQDSAGVDDLAEGGDGFGRAVTTGEFGNGSEVDVAVGVPFEDVGSVIDAGAAQVLYGSPSGPTATGNQLWTQDTGTVKDVAEESDQLGWALAGGDFDADGTDDLAVGVPREEVATVSVAGAANVLYGSVAGLSDARNQFWSQASGGIQEAPDFLDQFGFALAAADIDGDGDADLVVGVPGEPAAGGATAGGGVNVIDGSAGVGLTKTGNRFVWQDTPGIEDDAEPSDWFGRALVAADFGFGPEADVAVGVPEEEDGSVPTASGAFQVVYGSASGLSKDHDVLISQDTPGVKDAAEVSDRMGDALAGFG